MPGRQSIAQKLYNKFRADLEFRDWMEKNNYDLMEKGMRQRFNRTRKYKYRNPWTLQQDKIDDTNGRVHTVVLDNREQDTGLPLQA